MRKILDEIPTVQNQDSLYNFSSRVIMHKRSNQLSGETGNIVFHKSL